MSADIRCVPFCHSLFDPSLVSMLYSRDCDKCQKGVLTLNF